MGFLRPSSLCESDGMVASVEFRGDSETRVDRREFVSDIPLVLGQLSTLESGLGGQSYKVGRSSDRSLGRGSNHPVPIV